MKVPTPPIASVAQRSWWQRQRWLLLRRTTQIGVLALFLIGPWFGIWLVKGNLNSSLAFGVLPLTDPYLLLQTLASGHVAEQAAFIGAALVVVFYDLVGGRTYCAWVCPLNVVTDAAHWLRNRFGIRTSAHLGRETRYWILGTTLLLAAASGTLAWELVNPVSMLQRGLIFTMGAAWLVALAIFLFDVFVANRGWCGHLCPTGAFYSLIGRLSVLRVATRGRQACDDCMDCFAVCPEPAVIRAPLKDALTAPLILSSQCSNCGRCLDVCSKDVFAYATRFSISSSTGRQDAVPENQNPS